MTNLIITYIIGLAAGYLIGWYRLWEKNDTKNDETNIYYIQEHWTPELEALSRQQEAGSFRNDMGYEIKDNIDWIKDSAERDRAMMDELWESRNKKK